MTVSVKPPLKFAKKPPSSLQKQRNSRSIGTQAELRVISYLKFHEYSIVGHHVQCGHQELDIVAIDTTCNELVFIEVKYRFSKQWGSADVGVTPKKLLNLKKAVGWYLSRNPWKSTFRVDVIAATAGKLEQYKNVTWF